MAQEPDDLTAAGGTDGTQTPAEIERDIARTRADMTETIDALGARFEPAYLKEQAQEAIVDTARTAGTSMMDTIKDNPLPAAIAGLSIAWMIANRSSGTSRPGARVGVYGGPPSGRQAGSGDYGGGYGGQGTYGGGAGRDAESGGGPSLAAQARDKASGIADAVTGTATGIADSARGTAQDVAQQAQDAAQQAQSWLDGQMQRNPLGVGAVVLAAGALVGLSLPTTDAEERVMGAQASRVVGQVKEAAGERLDQAKQVASKVADEARTKVGEVVETVKSEAHSLAETAKAEAADAAGGASRGDAPDEGGPGGGPSDAPQAGEHRG